jgi:dUTP pyrophosphatase
MAQGSSPSNLRRLRIRRLSPAAPLPAYHSAGAAAFDLAARDRMSIAPGAVVLVPTGVVVEVPIDHALLIVARSSLPLKKKLIVANGVGVVDSDYRGPTDEVNVEVMNVSTTDAVIEAGERIAQGLIVPVVRVMWEEVEASTGPSRGGFGSTGGYGEGG